MKHCAIEQQQKSLEFEREQTNKMKNKLNNMLGLVCFVMKRLDCYKTRLNNLETKNKELNYNLAVAIRERDHATLLNNATVSDLQDQIDLLSTKIAQLENEHKQQLLLKDKFNKDETSKYKRLLENMKARSFQKHNAVRKNTCKNLKEHPALMDEENRKRKGKLYDELSDLEVDKVVRKRRRLFQDDEEMTDII
ncbi:PREDICTED: uncharacterized protein LOC105558444 isoform X2 [Vollenhovia emeryi]|uniref:uncharacterized protein LOC105558444 isoform X2 n=1 Tax=Vollenhovia emeryi TaxID=411798 RepID=UPI0005F4A6E8|nr:PREDICTED: uncharacterized protein LOC105558444 isoform X2 [Vollenhovia emeryi]